MDCGAHVVAAVVRHLSCGQTARVVVEDGVKQSATERAQCDVDNFTPLVFRFWVASFRLEKVFQNAILLLTRWKVTSYNPDRNWWWVAE
jgi:hypothetical protein